MPTATLPAPRNKGTFSIGGMTFVDGVYVTSSAFTPTQLTIIQFYGGTTDPATPPVQPDDGFTSQQRASLRTTYPSLDGSGRLAIGGVELTPAAIGATTGVALDTDGVPYFLPTGGVPIALDTDGVPYFAA